MSIEASLTRDLNIRFIDAKEITNEARVRCGIQGYPTREQQRVIVSQALKIFEQKSEEEKACLRRMNADMELIIKGSRGGGSRSIVTRSDTPESLCSSDSLSAGGERSRKGWLQRRLSGDHDI